MKTKRVSPVSGHNDACLEHERQIGRPFQSQAWFGWVGRRRHFRKAALLQGVTWVGVSHVGILLGHGRAAQFKALAATSYLQSPGEIMSREMELDLQESPGEIKRSGVVLDPQENPGEIKKSGVVLDPQESPG